MVAKRLSAGRLRHRITFEELVEAQDSDTGAITPTWVPIEGWENVAAEVTPVSVRELMQAQTINSKVTTRMVIRWRPEQPDARWRIVYRGQYYNNEGHFTDPDTGMDYLTIPCSVGGIIEDG